MAVASTLWLLLARQEKEDCGYFEVGEPDKWASVAGPGRLGMSHGLSADYCKPCMSYIHGPCDLAALQPSEREASTWVAWMLLSSVAAIIGEFYSDVRGLPFCHAMPRVDGR